MYSPNVVENLEMETFKVLEDDGIALLQLALSNLMLNCNNFYSGKSDGIGIVKTPYSYIYLCDDIQYECSFPFTVLDATKISNVQVVDVVDSINRNFPKYSGIPLKKLVDYLIKKFNKYNYVTERNRSLSIYLPQKETLEILSVNTTEKLQCIQKTNSNLLNDYFLKLFDYFPLTPAVCSQRRIFYTDITNARTNDRAIDDSQSEMSHEMLYMVRDVKSSPKSMEQRIESIMKQYVLPSMKIYRTTGEARFGVNDRNRILPSTVYDGIYCNFHLGPLELSTVSNYVYDDGVVFGIVADEELLNNWITCFGNRDKSGKNLLSVGSSNKVSLRFMTEQLQWTDLPIFTKERLSALLGDSFDLERWEQLSFPRTNEISDIFSFFVFRKRKTSIEYILRKIGTSMLTPDVENVLAEVASYASSKKDISGYIAQTLKDQGKNRLVYLIREILELSNNLLRDANLDVITPSVIARVITTDDDLRQFSSDSILQLTFPYRKYFISEGSTFRQMFARLESEKIITHYFGISRDEMWLCERRYPEDMIRVDAITDMIVEPYRIKCSENDKPSPLHVWASFLTEYPDVSEDYWTRKPNEARRAREDIYSVSRGCNLFNVSFCKELYTNFQPRSIKGLRIMDCAAGWGDRLIAAAAVRASVYTGWDPNTSLQCVYNEIINLTDMSSFANVKIHTSPMEDDEDYIKSNLASSYDIVISSPPFFTQEHYEGEETSTRRYRTREEWNEKYFKVMLECGVAALVNAGCFILYLPPYLFTTASSFLYKMNVNYEGKAAFLQKGGSKSTKRYAYVWRKADEKVGEVPRFVNNIMKKFRTTYEMATKINNLWYSSVYIDSWLASASPEKNPSENFALLRVKVCGALRYKVGFNYDYDEKGVTFLFIEEYGNRLSEKSQKAAKIIRDIIESRFYILSH